MSWRPPVTKPLLAFGTPKPQGDRSTFRVTSPFGYRDDPLNPGSQVFHGGLDLGDFGSGADVVAANNGSVLGVGYLKEPYSQSTTRYAGGNYGGWMVVLGHGGDWSVYAHMVPNSSVVRVGQSVLAGTKLGVVGDSGSAVGAPHLHFGIKVNGRDVDPWPLITGEDMELPTGLRALTFADLGASNRIRRDPGTTEGATVTDVPERVQVLGMVDRPDAAWNINGVAGTTWYFIGLRREVGFVATALLPTVGLTALGQTTIPVPPADCSKQDAKLVAVGRALPTLRQSATTQVTAIDALTKVITT